MKKWFKRIAVSVGALLLVAVVVLLALGQRSGAGQVHATTEIASTPQQIWPWINEGERLKQWVSWLQDVKQVAPDEAVWTMRDENNGGELMFIHSKAVELTPYTRKSVVLDTPGAFAGRQTYTLTDLGNGHTRLQVDAHYDFQIWFARLMEPLIMPQAEKKMVEDLARLKAKLGA